METLILGWYIYTTTNSVILLAIFGSFRFIGSLLSPWFGVAGDRWGRRKMMYMMRSLIMILALIIMTLSLLDMLKPYQVFVIAIFSGLVQPSDIVMRNSLIGDSVPDVLLMKATSFARIAHDSARIFGALVGASLFAWLGLGITYIFVVGIYVLSVCLTLGVSRAHPRKDNTGSSDIIQETQSLLGELKEGIAYIWESAPVLAIICLAFLANLTAFPVSHGLMPYVAKEILQIDQNGLGQLMAIFSVGAVFGSLILAVTRSQRHATRLMLVNLIAWYFMLAVFSQVETRYGALIVLFLVGLAHSLAMTSMSAALLGVTDQMVRGRVMGVRVLAIYGVPLGLIGSGFLIEHFGFVSFICIYVVIGVTFTTLIGFKWRSFIWNPIR